VGEARGARVLLEVTVLLFPRKKAPDAGTTLPRVIGVAAQSDKVGVDRVEQAAVVVFQFA